MKAKKRGQNTKKKKENRTEGEKIRGEKETPAEASKATR